MAEILIFVLSRIKNTMKRFFILTFFVCLIIQAQANINRDNKHIRITYQTSFNGKVNQDMSTIMDISENIACIQSINLKSEKDDPIQIIYLDYTNNEETKTAVLKNNISIYTIRDFKINDGLMPIDGVEKIAGYNCKKVKTIINSNTIEVWYTTELGILGSMQPQTAIPDGVVLKIVRNGQTAQTATKVELLKNAIKLKPQSLGTALDAPTYNYQIQQSKVISINVFNKESIYFRNIPTPTSLSDYEVMRFANGSILLKRVQLPDENKGYSIFAELSQYSEGDAYDRTGSVFLIPTDSKKSFLDGLLYGKDKLPFYTDKHGANYEGMTLTDNYAPPIELLRFYTSFGVRGYNHIKVAKFNWPDSVIYKQEITDYAKSLKGEVWIGNWIGNYSENGHNVTLNIKYYPDEETNNFKKEVYPLFTTVNILEMNGQAYPDQMFRNDSLTVKFKIDTDLKDAYIRYISTGHGGWGGGDEFNPKPNKIYLDDHHLITYTPWREDCGSYRNLNPASGNFSNGLSSSDLSRSGWCPGMTSYPIRVNVGTLKAGEHEVKVAIPVGQPEGSSRSYWCISGVLIGEK